MYLCVRLCMDVFVCLLFYVFVEMCIYVFLYFHISTFPQKHNSLLCNISHHRQKE